MTLALPYRLMEQGDISAMPFGGVKRVIGLRYQLQECFLACHNIS
jgi:hypothetical protein